MAENTHLVHKFVNCMKNLSILFTSLGIGKKFLLLNSQLWEQNEKYFHLVYRFGKYMRKYSHFVHKFGKYTKISQLFPVQ